MKRFRSIKADDFVINVSYEELLKLGSDKYTVKLKSFPNGINQIRIVPEQVDFLIEQVSSFPMLIKVGITGGIGSGKSVVSRLLEIMGIPVYIADTEAKRITCTDTVIRRELCALVGQEVFQGGELNRTLLAEYMFGYPEHVKEVNAIIHPRVKDDFRQWTVRFGNNGLVGMESAILIESGFREEVDFLVMVYAPLEVRVERAMKRDCSSRELVLKRIEAQMSDEAKREQADFVIVNDNETPLIPQVLELISLLSKNNHYLCDAKNN